MVHRILDAFSLTGAIVLLLFILTVYGIYKNNEKVWTTAFTSFSTFISGKKMGQLEERNKQEGKK